MEIEEIKSLLKEKLKIADDKIEQLHADPELLDLLTSYLDHNRKGQAAIPQEPEEPSAFLSQTTKEVRFRTIANRDSINQLEPGQGARGALFYFKEKAREFAIIAGLDPDEMRMAFTEGIQNIVEHGQGKDVEIEIAVENIGTEDLYFEMSFKHYMSTKEFYSLNDANKSADTGMFDFESPRGRGEFLMREIMDERKFLNGVEKKDDGSRNFFFKRLMRKYKNPKPKPLVARLDDDFKKYINSLQDFKSAMFVRMNYFEKKTEIVISEAHSSADTFRDVMSRFGYSFKGVDTYRNNAYSFWETDLDPEKAKGPFLSILGEIEKLLSKRKEPV